MSSVASNATTLADEEGSYPDWIEVHNSGTNAVDLLGWGLTDNASRLFKWRFPATNLPPGGYLIVFASDKDRRVPGAPLHTNFRLSATGSYLALVRPDGLLATRFAPEYPPQADQSSSMDNQFPRRRGEPLLPVGDTLTPDHR